MTSDLPDYLALMTPRLREQFDGICAVAELWTERERTGLAANLLSGRYQVRLERVLDEALLDEGDDDGRSGD